MLICNQDLQICGGRRVLTDVVTKFLKLVDVREKVFKKLWTSSKTHWVEQINPNFAATLIPIQCHAISISVASFGDSFYEGERDLEKFYPKNFTVIIILQSYLKHFSFVLLSQPARERERKIETKFLSLRGVDECNGIV